MDNFLDMLTLEGTGGQTDDTRSTFTPENFGVYRFKLAMMYMHRGPNAFFGKKWLWGSFDPVLVARSRVSATKSGLLA